MRRASAGAVCVLLGAIPAFAQDGLQLFQQKCAPCHADGAVSDQHAPPLSDMRKRQITAQAVMRMIDEGGRMAVHASGWTVAERQRVAEWIAGAPLTRIEASPSNGRCTT